MTPHRLRAPSFDGGVLAEPPLNDAGSVLANNRATLDARDHDFQGRRVARLRSMARAEVISRSKRFLTGLGLEEPSSAGGPWFVTGHQPELFHPGVWIKNFAIAGLARQHGGSALNLIVDDDLPKSDSIRVPSLIDGEIRVRPVPFDDGAGDSPFEDRAVRDEALFASFGGRVRETLGGLVADPLIERAWPLAIEAGRATDRLGRRLAAARRGMEQGWGIVNWDVPLSDVCQTEAFLWFASHLLAHLPRFREVHNAALARYRAAYHIRSRQHPVPALGREGDWLEAPFWAWRAASPRRRPLLTRQLARTVELRIAGEDEPFAEVRLSPDQDACCSVERLRELTAEGIRLRTRALTTTMFARDLLGDLFVHGIGGAKYDELGDEIHRSFFGSEPPKFLTLSMTNWLGLPIEPVSADDLRGVERELRDLTFNPDRHIESGTAEIAALVAAKREAIAGPVATRRQRIERGEIIGRINEAMQPAVADRRDRLEGLRREQRVASRRNKIARGREFAFVLHSASRLREAFARVAPAAFPTRT